MQQQTVHIPIQNPAPACPAITTVTCPTPVFTSPQACFVQPDSPAKQFNTTAGRATGWLQLSCGIAAIVLGIAGAVITSYVGISGNGIWAGLLIYVPTGILGANSSTKNNCVNIAYLVMSIISAVFGGSMMITGAAGAGNNVCRDYDSYYYDYSYYANYQYCDRYNYRGINDALENGRVAVDALLGIVGLIELIAAIVGAAYCCGGVRCCPGAGQPSSTLTTVIQQPQQQYIVTNAPQMQQPIAQVAPPQPMGAAGGAPQPMAAAQPMTAGGVPPQYPVERPPPYAPNQAQAQPGQAYPPNFSGKI